LRLAPFMNDLISPCQSAFIKKRSIHDNFLYVRNLTRKFHRSKTPTLLIKLDITKAFDSVRWDYLFPFLSAEDFCPDGRTGSLRCSQHLPRGCFSMGCPLTRFTMAGDYDKGTPSPPSYLSWQSTPSTESYKLQPKRVSSAN
jgi:hypothetical protein